MIEERFRIRSTIYRNTIDKTVLFAVLWRIQGDSIAIFEVQLHFLEIRRAYHILCSSRTTG